MKKLINKILSFFSPVACGILGALGGTVNKMFRRFFMPATLASLAFSETESILTLTIMSMMGILSIGYGIPDATDKGSALGRFFSNLTNQNHLLANILARGTIGIGIALSLISLPIIKHTWLVYLICSLGIILTNALLSWRNLGQFNLFGIKLNWSEFITYTLISLFAVLIIKIK
jgi:hypothetical protein